MIKSKSYVRLEQQVNYKETIKLPNIKLKSIKLINPINRDRMLIEIEKEVKRAIKFFEETKKQYEFEYILLDRLKSNLQKRLQRKYLLLLRNHYSDCFYYKSDLIRDIKYLDEIIGE